MVVPVYNNERYVRRCVDSLRDQTLQDIEIICINDGSTDSSSEILHEYARADSRIVVLDKENSGYGVNINRGFAMAQGEYVGILESDDFAEPEMLEILYTAAKKHDLDIARANFSLYWSSPERDVFLELFKPEECGRVINPENRPDQHCFYVQPAIWSAVYKRSFIEENALKLLETPGAAYQDTAFNFKLWACAKRVWFYHEPLIHYRQDNEASSINNPNKVYCICDEYEEVVRWLADERPDLKKNLSPVAAKMRFDAYAWNIGRIAAALKSDFAKRMSQDFNLLASQGVLDKSLFGTRQWFDCLMVMKDPQKYCDFLIDAQKEAKGPWEKIARKASLGSECVKLVGLRGLVAILTEKR